MRAALLCIVILATAFCSISALHVKGSIELDSWTFDKVVGGSAPVLVKFDKDYAYGEKEDAFKEVCKRLGEAGANMIVGVVGVQEYGDKLNEDLAEKFAVKKDDFPVYKLFKAGSMTPIDYSGEVKADDITRFLKTEANLYIALPGCLQEFDDLATKFMAEPANRAQLKAKADEAAAQLSKDSEQASGKYYALVMKKILEKGDGFAATEMERISKIMAGSITPDKKDLFQKRLNILPSFKAGKQEL